MHPEYRSGGVLDGFSPIVPFAAEHLADIPDVPGAHVVIRTGGREVPERVLRRAAALAAGQSKARTAPSVGVDYTLCKHVNRVRAGPPGLANYSGEKTRHVLPESLVD